jgi:hypothetical protein
MGAAEVVSLMIDSRRSPGHIAQRINETFLLFLVPIIFGALKSREIQASAPYCDAFLDHEGLALIAAVLQMLWTEVAEDCSPAITDNCSFLFCWFCLLVLRWGHGWSVCPRERMKSLDGECCCDTARDRYR